MKFDFLNIILIAVYLLLLLQFVSLVKLLLL